MRHIKSIMLVSLVMDNVHSKLAIVNQYEILQHFVVVDVMPYVLVIVTIPGCIMLSYGSLHSGMVFQKL